MGYLLERIARDEQRAAAGGDLHWSSARVAAECDAKRRILAYAEILLADVETRHEGLELLEILASAFAEEPSGRR